MGAVKLPQGHVETTTTVGTVQLCTPSSATDMDPDSARRLAVVLIEAARDAEQPPVSDWP